jgi:hypothetical protein
MESQECALKSSPFFFFSLSLSHTQREREREREIERKRERERETHACTVPAVRVGPEFSPRRFLMALVSSMKACVCVYVFVCVYVCV